MVLAAASLSGCQDSYDAPALVIPEAKWQPNTTLMEFKNLIDQAAGSEQSYGFLVGKKDNGDDIIIHGRVISCDASGNIYQALYIQDETTAFVISVAQPNLWSDYRIGQEVVINATGTYAGKYAGLYQIGSLAIYNDKPSLGRISYLEFLDHSERNGMPVGKVETISIDDAWPSNQPYCIETNEISKITSYSGGAAKIMGQLVRFNDVSFIDGGMETFAPYHENGDRYIVDSRGIEILVRNSGYSNFYNLTLPEGTGSVRGVLGYFNGKWQLFLRDIDDVMFADMPGYTKDSALTVDEAIAQENSGRNLWVKGYIVGSVKAGVSFVRSNDDVIFGADAELPTTVLIAPKADVKDFQQCIVVQLGQHTSIAKAVNLKDNPGVYGKMLYVKGSLQEYLGISGLTGADIDFAVE